MYLTVVDLTSDAHCKCRNGRKITRGDDFLSAELFGQREALSYSPRLIDRCEGSARVGEVSSELALLYALFIYTLVYCLFVYYSEAARIKHEY